MLERQIRKQECANKRRCKKRQLEEMDAQAYKWDGLRRLRKRLVPQRATLKIRTVIVSQKQTLSMSLRRTCLLSNGKSRSVTNTNSNTFYRALRAGQISERGPQKIGCSHCKLKRQQKTRADVAPELLKWSKSDSRWRLLVQHNRTFVGEQQILPFAMDTL